MWEEVHPYLKFEVPQCRGVLHDSENGFPLQFGVEMMSNFGALMEASMERKKKRKTMWEGGGKASEFYFFEGRERIWLLLKKDFLFPFSKSNCHMSHFEWSKRGPPLPLDVTSYTATRREKFDLLNAKILPRFACRLYGSSSSCFSTPVEARFRKYTIYIYIYIYIYIKTLRMRPWAWFRGWFCLIISYTQNDNF